MYDKSILAYEVYETDTSGGYRHTHVRFRLMYEEDTAVHLEGTVDNKAGYGTMDAAIRKGRIFQAMLDAGHTVFFDSTHSGLDVHLRWQHYQGTGTEVDYCDPSYESFGRSFGQIEEGIKTLKQMGRKIEKMRAKRRGSEVRPVSNHTFSRPEDLVEILAASGYKEVHQEFDTWEWSLRHPSKQAIAV